MIVCRQCGRENEDHYKFCLGCAEMLKKPLKATDTSAGEIPKGTESQPKNTIKVFDWILSKLGIKSTRDDHW